MLNEMDGFTREGGVMVIAATNITRPLMKHWCVREGLTKNTPFLTRIIKPELN